MKYLVTESDLVQFIHNICTKQSSASKPKKISINILEFSQSFLVDIPIDEDLNTTETSFNPIISIMEQKTTEEIFIESAIAVIEKNLSESDFDIEKFSEELRISKSSLYRRVISLTSLTPAQLIKSIRLKHAEQMLLKKHGSVSEIAYSVGFSDPKYFTACFKTEYGVTPTEFVKRTNVL